MLLLLSFTSIILCHCLVHCDDHVFKSPTIFVAIFARNKEITLPYFLWLLQEQDYPKDRISLWIVTDHNVDRTVEILETWIPTVEPFYHSVNVFIDENETKFPDENGPSHWSPQRFKHMIRLKEEALNVARSKWADFIFFLDCDVLLSNNQTFKYLITQNSTVTAPMLKSVGMYSNFWCGMTDKYYYLRTDEYKPILRREKKGCFNVPMVHSAVAINLNHAKSDHLTFNSSYVKDYNGPIDDIITFALSANYSDISLYLCNEEAFGYVMLPLESHEPLYYDELTLTNLKVDNLVDNPPISTGDLFLPYLSNARVDKMGFDEIYMINLERRPERRRRMLESFSVLGMNVSIFDAVDGRTITDEYIESLGIEFMPEYKDPYHKRFGLVWCPHFSQSELFKGFRSVEPESSPDAITLDGVTQAMTHGEIGCFLSHYFIWEMVVRKGEDVVMVLEDDVQFEPYFRQKVTALLKEVSDLKLPWDLIYIGRKRLVEDEKWVRGSKSLVHVAYSYWTLGYLLTNQGARKLLDQQPLKNLIPVDEYIPILFDKHPEEKWKKHFPKRNLIAYSAAPLLLYPTHYTGEEGYISDTENSAIIDKVSPPEVREEL